MAIDYNARGIAGNNNVKLVDITDDGLISKREVLTQEEFTTLESAGTLVSTTEYIIVG